MIPAAARIFVATKPVDVPGSFERFGSIVRERLGVDPRSGSFWVFMNRSGHKLKVLLFE